MRKIISLFQRNYGDDRLVRDEVVPGAEWVLAGEGVATRKYDGTCCLWQGGVLYKRYELKRGKTAPDGFIAAQEADAVTGDMPGWVPVGDGPDDQYHREALHTMLHCDIPSAPHIPGTCELLGPKIQGNAEGCIRHVLMFHDRAEKINAPRDFDGLKIYLTEHNDIEGIVWHHPDGRMVKIKGKDFGIKRVPRVRETGGAA